ncbi:MAG: hypothetical protein PUD47_00725 [Bacteroidales bacterium]|nr:hypothetical protein [Bacteroidales bacterium]
MTLKKIVAAINNDRLMEALQLLAELCAQEKEQSLAEEAATLRTHYSYLLDYYAKGVDDPERRRLFVQTKRQLYLLANRVEWALFRKQLASQLIDWLQNVPDSYLDLKNNLTEFKRQLDILAGYPEDEEEERFERELYEDYERDTNRLFCKAYGEGCWTEEDLQQVTDLLEDPCMPYNALAVLVSGVSLSLFRLLDPRRYEFLVRVCQQRGGESLSIRALTGILLCITLHPQETAFLPCFREGLKALKETGGPLQRQAFLLMKQFIIAWQTESISKHMNEDLLPSLMQSARYTVEKMNNQKDLQQSLEEMEDESDPEWQKAYNKIRNGIQELCDLQLQGADTYFSTFRQLKNNRFFYQLPHWFYPFDFALPQVRQLLPVGEIERGSVLHSMLYSPVFCDSDKFAFALSIASLPKEHRRFLSTAQGSEAIGMEEGIPSAENAGWQEEGTNSRVIRSYVQDLYRYCKLWHYRQEIVDVFQPDVRPWENPLLAETLLSADDLFALGDALFDRGFLQEAGTVFQRMLDTRPCEDSAVWQKMGYIYQKTGRPAEAIGAYLQADSLTPGHVWTLRHLAQCYRDNGETGQALQYLLQAEQLRPDSHPIQLQLAQLLMMRQEYKEALKHWFKLEYFGKYLEKVYRGICWCYLMTGRSDDALRFYTKLQNGYELTDDDWMNLGHLYRLQGRQEEAMKAYTQSCQLSGSVLAFRKKLETDRRSFTRQLMLDETDTAIIADAVEQIMQSPIK